MILSGGSSGGIGCHDNSDTVHAAAPRRQSFDFGSEQLHRKRFCAVVRRAAIDQCPSPAFRTDDVNTWCIAHEPSEQADPHATLAHVLHFHMLVVFVLPLFNTHDKACSRG